MSEEKEHDAPPEYAGIRPTPHYLMLLLRAAVVDDGHGGPWLYIYCSSTTGGATIYTHHIVTKPGALASYSAHRALMISGTEALGFAAEHKWASITAPSVAELRALGTYAVEAERIDEWATWRSAWLQAWGARHAQRLDRAKRAEAAARGLRWALAETWLRKPAE